MNQTQVKVLDDSETLGNHIAPQLHVVQCDGAEVDREAGLIARSTPLSEAYSIMTKGLQDIIYATNAMTGKAPSPHTSSTPPWIDDLCGGTPKGPSQKRRGRPNASDETVQRESKIAADWKQARDAGIRKAVFSEEIGMSLQSLDALLNRVAKRILRSDKLFRH